MWFNTSRFSKDGTAISEVFTNYRQPKNKAPWIKRPFPQNTCLVSGHRGSSFEYPENTMLSFREAIKEGGGSIETDVWKSSDGEYVLIHDATVDRTTPESGGISTFTASELTSMDAGSWKGSQFADRDDTRIPTLKEFLDEFKGQPIFLTLHIKLGVSDCKAIMDLVEQRGQLGQCLIFTNRNRLKELKNHNPHAIVMNDGTSHELGGLYSQAEDEGWDAMSAGLANYRDNENLIPQATDIRLLKQISFISSNFENLSQESVDLGINIILTDNVAVTAQVVRENGLAQISPIAGFLHNPTLIPSNQVRLELSNKAYHAVGETSDNLRNAFDGSSSTEVQFDSNGNVSIAIDLGTAEQVVRAEIWGRTGTSTVREFMLQGSNDSIDSVESWVNLTQGGLDNSGEYQSFPFNNSQSYRYYRLISYENYGGISTRIHDIRLFKPA